MSATNPAEPRAALAVEMPTECPGCGQKRLRLGAVCVHCIAARREEADASRQRDREPWPPRA